jgi:hypothetical protein
MLKSVKGLPSEREADDNALFGMMKGGFDTINTIKARLEKACPRVVSCADIIAAAAKHALKVVWSYTTVVLSQLGTLLLLVGCSGGAPDWVLLLVH